MKQLAQSQLFKNVKAYIFICIPQFKKAVGLRLNRCHYRLFYVENIHIRSVLFLQTLLRLMTHVAWLTVSFGLSIFKDFFTGPCTVLFRYTKWCLRTFIVIASDLSWLTSGSSEPQTSLLWALSHFVTADKSLYGNTKQNKEPQDCKWFQHVFHIQFVITLPFKNDDLPFAMLDSVIFSFFRMCQVSVVLASFALRIELLNHHIALWFEYVLSAKFYIGFHIETILFCTQVEDNRILKIRP